MIAPSAGDSIDAIRGAASAAETPLDGALLEQLGDLEPALACRALQGRALATAAAVSQLAEAALERAEANAGLAQRWLALATYLEETLGGDSTRLAQIHYAQARIYVQQGDLSAAEQALHQAQRFWLAANDNASWNRSMLGLTQILAMQGRYAEAENTAKTAIANLASPALSTLASDAVFATRLQQVAAHDNLATVYLYQDQHTAALAEYEHSQQVLSALALTLDGHPAATAKYGNQLHHLLAHNALSRATALTFLDQTGEAEAALHAAIALYNQADDTLNRGRAYTNLGRLYLRTGRYAAALHEFDRSARDLIGLDAPEAVVDVERLRLADELLLEHATAYLAMNLLPEAAQALARCELLFRNAQQPYELGQTLYTLGLLHLHNEDMNAAEQALNEAARYFTGLQNDFWNKRTALALAQLAYRQGQQQMAVEGVDALLNDTRHSEATTLHGWDLNTLIEARLLRLRLYIDQHELTAARQQAADIAQSLQAPLLYQSQRSQTAQPILPHLYFKLQHMLGLIQQAAGNGRDAIQHLYAAVDLLEGERAMLPIEEVRTAFMDDKQEIYADLLAALLSGNDELQQKGDIDQVDQRVAAAFAVSERARSRTLLERLQSSLNDENEETAQQRAPSTQAELQQATALRRQLHWLYNQVLGEDGNRVLDAQASQRLQTQEAALQRLEWRLSSDWQMTTWRQSPWWSQVQTVDLATFQQALAIDQQAVIYLILHQEVATLLVDRRQALVCRRLCTVDALERAQSELRFQLGRVEVGAEGRSRRAGRLQEAAQRILQHLYQMLIAPLAEHLHSPRLLFIPQGSLHLLPFHALWDGSQYLVQRFECTYAPSASIVGLQRTQEIDSSFRSWAGLALSDPAIPAAEQEVRQAARYFAQAEIYFDEQANRNALTSAASQVDVLHIATHGLFRPDNPFFSAFKLADGWIDVRELYRLPLKARLVVLSACESGASQVRGSDEAIGLARGLLGAGARQLVVSLWNVHDASSAALMERFYAYLMAHDQEAATGLEAKAAAQALRAAQLAAIEAQAHPYFWAPFLVIGEN